MHALCLGSALFLPSCFFHSSHLAFVPLLLTPLPHPPSPPPLSHPSPSPIVKNPASSVTYIKRRTEANLTAPARRESNLTSTNRSISVNSSQLLNADSMTSMVFERDQDIRYGPSCCAFLACCTCLLCHPSNVFLSCLPCHVFLGCRPRYISVQPSFQPPP